jgi:hypothetical protein
MAPSKKKGAPPASASSKSVRLPGSKKADGIATRAERRVVNKSVHKATRASGYELAKTVIAERKEAGRVVAAQTLSELIGKPLEWSKPLEEALFALISTGHSMDEIATITGMPSVYQMLKWLSDPAHPFSVTRARAKDMLVPLYEEQGQRIAVNSNPCILKTRRQVLDKFGAPVWIEETKEIDNVARSALALQGLQWTLSHLMPKKHGLKPEPTAGPNEQLEGLFAALKAGPAE